MTKLKRIWIERDVTEINKDTATAIRLDWDNDRHQRIEITGTSPTHLIDVFTDAVFELEAELSGKYI